MFQSQFSRRLGLAVAVACFMTVAGCSGQQDEQATNHAPKANQSSKDTGTASNWMLVLLNACTSKNALSTSAFDNICLRSAFTKPLIISNSQITGIKPVQPCDKNWRARSACAATGWSTNHDSAIEASSTNRVNGVLPLSNL